MKKTIFIKAYLNMNLGDDLFLDILLIKYPNVNFMMIVPNENFVFLEKYKNLKIIKKNKFLRLLDKLGIKLMKKSFVEFYFEKKCVATITIGGSLFIQNKYWINTYVREKNNFYLSHPNFLIGANFGPFYDNEYLYAYTELFSKYSDICFRDTYSYDLFKTLENVRIAPDVVFSFDTYIKAIAANVKTANKSISLSIMDVRKKTTLEKADKYKQKIIEVISHFCNNGYEVNLISFCRNEGDLDYIYEILKCSGSEHINVINYEGNLEQILEILINSEYIVASRFHSMILGWLLRKPVYPIVYSKKMENVIKDVEFKGNYVTLDNIKGLSYQSIEDNKHCILKVDDLIHDAEQQFEGFENFLRGEII